MTRKEKLRVLQAIKNGNLLAESLQPPQVYIFVAETEGFEPSIRFPVYTLSRRASSTTRASLRVSAPTQSTPAQRAAKIKNLLPVFRIF